MVCSKCGRTIAENGNIRFCPNCGNPLPEQEPALQHSAGGHNARPVRSARSGVQSAKAPSGAPREYQGGAANDNYGFGFREAPEDPDRTRYGAPNGAKSDGNGAGFIITDDADDITVYGVPHGVKNGGGSPVVGGEFVFSPDAAEDEATAYGTPGGMKTINNHRNDLPRQSQNPLQGDNAGNGFGFMQEPSDADATVYGARNGGAPFGGTYGSRSGGPNDTFNMYGGGYPDRNNEGGRQQENDASGNNKKFLAIIIPLIAVILAALTVIFIFIVLPAIRDADETTTEAVASQETEEKTEAAAEKEENTTKAEDTTAAKDNESTKTADENVSAAAAAENTTAPLGTDGYQPGHYVNSTEARVVLRGSTNKNGKALDRIQQDEFVEVTEVLDLGSSDATVRWWGKVTKNGKTGWVSLYYMTCVDLKGSKVSEAQIRQLWESLEGYWNTLDKKRFSQCSMNNGAPYFMYGPWYSEPAISAHVDLSGIGEIDGLIKLHLSEPASGDPNGYYVEAVSADLYLDLSEKKNGRIAWSFGNGWEDGSYAGKDQSKAMPKT